MSLRVPRVLVLFTTGILLPGLAAGAADPALRKAAQDLGARFVAGVNATDSTTRAAAVREVMTSSALAGDGVRKVFELMAKLEERYGRLTLHHAEAVSGGDAGHPRLSLHVYARTARDQGWKDLQFFLDPTPPYRIRNLVFVAEVAEPVYLPNGAITDPQTLEWLNGYIDKLVAEDDLAGSLLVAQGDRVVVQRSFGFADSARTRLIGPATRMNLGSGGKMFTALAVAQLVEAGRLRYTDTLARVLPAVATQPFARKVTLHHLLSHTSGIGEFWTDDYERHWRELRRLSDYLPYILAAGTRFEPGARYEYSNSNFLLLGLVLEAATGRSYDQVVGERIFGPLTMRDTGLFPFDDRDPAQAQRLARGTGRGWHQAPHGYRGSSAGGALSTSGDMLRFARALCGGRIVSRPMLGSLTTSRTSGLPDSSMPYGYGFILDGKGPGRSFGHGGIAAGVNFELRYFPATDVTLIAFSNQDNGAYDDLRRNTIRLITGER